MSQDTIEIMKFLDKLELKRESSYYGREFRGTKSNIYNRPYQSKSSRSSKYDCAEDDEYFDEYEGCPTDTGWYYSDND